MMSVLILIRLIYPSDFPQAYAYEYIRLYVVFDGGKCVEFKDKIMGVHYGWCFQYAGHALYYSLDTVHTTVLLL